MINLLTAEMLSIEQITKNTPPQNVAAGREDYQAGRVTIETVGQSSARLQVRDHKINRIYVVSVWLHTRQIALSCTCRESYQWYLCRHRVAGALALREHLLAHPPKLWQAVLEQTSQPPARRPNLNYGPIVFSLQERNTTWAVVPYSLAARLFATHELGDRAAIAKTIEQVKLSLQAKPIRSRISRQSYPGATDTELAAVNLAVGNPYMLSGYSYGRENAFYEPVLALLPGSLVYTGQDGDPLQTRVEVLPDVGTIEAELRQAKQGLRLIARVVVGDRTLPIKRRDTTVIVADPPWLLISGTLVQLKSADGLASALLEYPELVIPPEDEETFLEKHLLPLTEHVTVRGDMIEWQDVDAEPQPRLYLSEAADGLQAELRFGYGAYELAYDKRLPANATLRQPGTATLARITRRPASEQAAWQELAAYGLKRGPEPQLWLIKKSTHPIDFLMHQVPKLAEAGYTIYGEEALTLARVNRNKPSISFNVSSGIDWFDVTAVVNYGDLAVSLKTIRQAIKRREKYVKLADGTIGQLPEEWIERYRHMLALGEEHGDDLRFSQHHITMLDQLLSDADRARTDEAFERRREKLRGFERIEPHPLPTTFKGELRPYQKFGYDWMHFLREYGFGGCLADDMGTGKCVAPDTAILVNGIPQAAELVWNTYAKPESFDGDGYWAVPSERLLVNSIDEQTGQITQAPIRRLYRQWVRERLRTVVLEDGHRITITQQHRLLTRGGWTNQLAVGDYVCVPAKLVVDARPIDPDLITLLAWQIAEGYEMPARANVRIFQREVELLQDLQALFQRLAQRYDLAINRPAIAKPQGRTPALVVNSRAYQQFLASLGYTWGRKSREKSIPAFVMQADLDSIRLFLRHFFEAEGSATLVKRCVEISSASPMIIQQIDTLLRRLGIWARVSERQKCATNGLRIVRTYYQATISGNAVRRFAHEVGFVSQRKQQILDAVCAYESNTNSEGIPASDLVAQAVRASQLPVRHFGMHNTVYFDGSQQFSRHSLERVVGGFDRVLSGQAEQEYRQVKRSKWTAHTLAAYASLDHAGLRSIRAQIQQLLDQEVFFCRISAIEEVEYTGWVYDFEVEQHHNFVANGMLCHNTIQALAFLESLYEANNEAPASLIVMPRSLLFNWQREAEKFAPELAVYVHADQGRIADPAEFAQYDLVLTTYGTMLRDVEKLRQYQFNYAILDESQAIKNPLAETSKAARLLRADHRLVLTGTPIENSTLELWSQFAFLNPGLLGDISYFREQFVTPIERQQNGDTAQFLRKMVFPFILRRTKDQVAADLPPRSEEIVMCDMEPAQRKLYNKQRDYYRALLLGLIDNDGMNDARMKILEGLLRLRQISNHPRLVDTKFKGVSGKFELLLDTLDTLRAEGHRALVFSQFVQMLTIVREALDARAVPYCYLDGQTRDRQGEVDRFQNDAAVPFFLISLKAGGVGLNLTAADYVIHIDPWWNPAVEMQATDRTHRIGQDKPVFVYKLIARDSVEEKILQLQDHKRALVEQVIGAEGGVFKSLSREDIEVLFS